MRALKKIRKSQGVRRLASWLITQYIKFVWLTNKWEWIGLEHAQSYIDEDRAFIGCFWHSRLLMMLKIWKGPKQSHMLVSSHPDGEIIARAAENFGFKLIAGSTSKGGQQALRKILSVLKKDNSIGITPDGPRGPRYKASKGVIQMARLAKVDIFPVAFSSTRRILMKSWDRFCLPLPFGRGIFIAGEPISVVNSSLKEEKIRMLLENTLNELTLKADQLCGWGNEAEIPREAG